MRNSQDPILCALIYTLGALGVLAIAWLTIVVSAAIWHFTTGG